MDDVIERVTEFISDKKEGENVNEAEIGECIVRLTCIQEQQTSRLNGHDKVLEKYDKLLEELTRATVKNTAEIDTLMEHKRMVDRLVYGLVIGTGIGGIIGAVVTLVL